MTVEIVEATPELIERFYGVKPPFTLRGHVAMDGDRVVGVGGIHYLGNLAIAFTDFKDMSRKDRARCFRFLEQRFSAYRGKLCAICDPNHAVSSRRLLARLGFVDNGNMWVRPWLP